MESLSEYEEEEEDFVYRLIDMKEVLRSQIRDVMPIGKKFKLIRTMLDIDLQLKNKMTIDLGWKRYFYHEKFKLMWNFEFGTFEMSKLVAWGESKKFIVISQ